MEVHARARRSEADGPVLQLEVLTIDVEVLSIGISLCVAVGDPPGSSPVTTQDLLNVATSIPDLLKQCGNLYTRPPQKVR